MEEIWAGDDPTFGTIPAEIQPLIQNLISLMGKHADPMKTTLLITNCSDMMGYLLAYSYEDLKRSVSVAHADEIKKLAIDSLLEVLEVSFHKNIICLEDSID